MKILTSPVSSIIALLAFAGVITWVLNETNANAPVAALSLIVIAVVGGLLASSLASR